MTKQAILVVDDNPDFQTGIRAELEILAPNLEYLDARGVRAAREVFLARRDHITLIVMDGNLPDGTFEETLKLVRDIRASGFKGIMLAASGNYRHQEMLLKAGCDEKAVMPGTSYQICRLLGIPIPNDSP